MHEEAFSRARRLRTQKMLADLQEQIKAWLIARRAADVRDGMYMGRHESQLVAIEGALLYGAIPDIEVYLQGGGEDATVTAVYARCRKAEQALTWVRRLHQFYVDRFAQRKEDRVNAMLCAADELIWSCYRQVWLRTEGDAGTKPRQGATPLPLVELDYLPSAITADTPVPADLQYAPSAADTMTSARIQEVASALPTPILRLPSWCVEEPWWLVFVAHEMGHHIQHEMEWTKYVADGIGKAVQQAKDEGRASQADPARWRMWGEEIFADFFSLLMIGPAALRAIYEVEVAAPEEMARRHAKYPSPVVRMGLLTTAMEKLGLASAAEFIPPPDFLQGIVAADARASSDWDAIPYVISFLRQPFPCPDGTDKTLEAVCSIYPDLVDEAGTHATTYPWPTEEVEAIRDALIQRQPIEGTGALYQARVLAAGALEAWDSIVVAGAESTGDNLRAAVCRALKESGPTETRSENGVGQDQNRASGEDVGHQFVSSLLHPAIKDAGDDRERE